MGQCSPGYPKTPPKAVKGPFKREANHNIKVRTFLKGTTEKMAGKYSNYAKNISGC